MTEERLKEIKDSIEFQEIMLKDNILTKEEKELYDEVINLQQENERLKKKHNFVETALLEEETDLYIEVITLKEENERLKKELNNHIKEGIEKDQVIEKTKAKLRSMFDNGNEETILDDLLELDKVLGSDKE